MVPKPQVSRSLCQMLVMSQSVPRLQNLFGNERAAQLLSRAFLLNTACSRLPMFPLMKEVSCASKSWLLV